MLSKIERLKEKYLFKIAFKKRQKLNSIFLSLYYLFKRNDINKLEKVLPKVAFIVGLGVSKKATKRNLIKRRMRNAYQLVKQKLFNINNKLSSVSVLIWVAHPTIASATFKQIKDSTEKILNKLSI